MLKFPKNQVWYKLHKLFECETDGTGTTIDAGILDTVVALNAAGIRTKASCEGHLHRMHAKAYPWIDIQCPQADALEAEILACLDQDSRSDKGRSPKTGRLIYKHRSLLVDEERKLTDLLGAFYRVHPMEYDRHLVIIRFIKGECRLQSHGSEYQQYRPIEERAEKLKEYQEETQQFALFLKERFFSGPNTFCA
jgi:hypothetical protein